MTNILHNIDNYIITINININYVNIIIYDNTSYEFYISEIYKSEKNHFIFYMLSKYFKNNIKLNLNKIDNKIELFINIITPYYNYNKLIIVNKNYDFIYNNINHLYKRQKIYIEDNNLV